MAKTFNELARKTMTRPARARARKRARQIMAGILLSELRQAVGPTQKELARRLGIAQPTLSRLEKQTDMQVTTLRRLVAALGGELEIVARFRNRRLTIRQFGKTIKARRGLHERRVA
jgi:transcriptional regulator with XRE-family HTH domain